MSSSNINDSTKYDGCMTPSIINTINNTSPTPPVNSSNNNNNINNGNSSLPKTRRPTEPFYESYIEDSFVGHWEREDDDFDDKFNKINSDGTDANAAEEDESALHPSTIEFDFDSFGPESFIYTPSVPKPIALNKNIEENEVKEKEIVKSGNSVELSLQADQLRTMNLGADQPHSAMNSPQPDAFNPGPLDHLVDNVQIDLKVIEPYKKVISHAGYCHHYDSSSPAPNPGEPAPAVIVFSACYLPDRSRRDYNYVMDHLFLYVLSSLHELIADDYILIYLHNTQPSTTASTKMGSPQVVSSSGTLTEGSSTSPLTADDSHNQNNLPTFNWMKRCYQMIDRKLRKNLKILYLVKPTFWLKTIVIMCKPFISTKFSKKLRFVESMDGLKKCLPVDKLILPASAENI